MVNRSQESDYLWGGVCVVIGERHEGGFWGDGNFFFTSVMITWMNSLLENSLYYKFVICPLLYMFYCIVYLVI